MNKKAKEHLGICFVLLGLLILQGELLNHDAKQGYHLKRYAQWNASIAAPTAFEYFYSSAYPDSIEYRIAHRLKRRLRKNGKLSPSVHAVAEAVERRQALLQKDVRVTFITDDDPEYGVWNASTSRYPTWIDSYFSISQARYQINPVAIQDTLKSEPIIDIVEPEDVVITEVVDPEDEEDPVRVEIEGVAKPGHEIDVTRAVVAISEAFSSDEKETAVPLNWVPGKIINETGNDYGDLELLSVGRSNFRGSTRNRAFNVRKALSEHVNNIVVAPGETFSFNGTLGGPVTESRGWRMAKVIFNGDELKPAPGGGICQASTTTYRAIVNAGLPVIDRHAHSLYVSYYKAHGVGIDATIYPGSQDLSFENDTGEHVLVQAYSDGDDAYVSIYGTDDGREVELQGPYFAWSAPEGFKVRGRAMSPKEIAWVQRVVYADGTEEQNVILSRYKELPASLGWEYAQKVEVEEVAEEHASAE